MARARRQGHRVAVLYIDLDKFKPVNDTYGHVIGDELLQVLSNRMQKMMRETDIVARIGGDEFSVLLADLDDVSNSYIVACKLLDMLSQPVESQRGTHTVGASIGISTYPDDGNDPQKLLRLADAAMYRVKQGGRSGVSFYSANSGSPSLIDTDPRPTAIADRPHCPIIVISVSLRQIPAETKTLRKCAVSLSIGWRGVAPLVLGDIGSVMGWKFRQR
jgi:diguanylate cyclase (GGDEF)-like protein